jgi:hypothetical protein
MRVRASQVQIKVRIGEPRDLPAVSRCQKALLCISREYTLLRWFATSKGASALSHWL